MVWVGRRLKLKNTTILPFLFILLFVIPIPIIASHSTEYSTTQTETNTNYPVTTIYETHPYIETHLVETNTSFIYVTNVGNYTFSKLTPSILKYKSRNNRTLVSYSTFWLNTTARKLPLPKPTARQVIATNLTYKVTVGIKRTLLDGTLVANITQLWNFTVLPPKVTVWLNKTLNWDLGDFNIWWGLIGCSYIRRTNTNVSGYDREMVYRHNITKIELTIVPPVNASEWLVVDWRDEGNATVLYGKIEFPALTVTGIKVLFTKNDPQIDPTLIATTSDSYGTAFPYQTKTFYAQGRWWVFWAKGGIIYWNSSVDGVNWDTSGQVDYYPYLLIDGCDFAVYSNGTHVSLAYHGRDNPDDPDIKGITTSWRVLWRLGTLFDNGSISWGAQQMIERADWGYQHNIYPVTVIDSNGYAWVGYLYGNSTTNPVHFNATITKNSFKNESWSTDSGFPVYLTNTNYTSWRVAIAPLSNGDVYVVYGNNEEAGAYGGKLYGRLWDSNTASFGTEEVITQQLGKIGGEPLFSVRGYTDEVYLVYCNEYFDTYGFKKRDSSGSWDGYTGDSYIDGGLTLSIDRDTGDSYIFWAYQDRIKYEVRKANGDVTDYTVWIDESSTGTGERLTNDGDNIAVSPYVSDNKIGVLYMTYENSPFKVKFALLTLNQPPMIGEFQAPTITYANKYFFVNCTIVDSDGVTDFVNATIELSYNIVLKWENSTNTFSEYQDVNNYCTLDSSGSLKVDVNSTAYKLCWRIKLSWSFPEGYVSIISTNTVVFDNQGASSSNSQTNLFYFEDDLIIHSADVNDDRVNPSQTITFTGTIYYEGTTIPPEDVSGITAKIELDGVEKGSTTTIDANGQFSISLTAESSVAVYSYNVYVVTDENSVQNQTVTVIVDRLKVVLKGASDTRDDIGDTVRVYFKVTREYDGALFDSTKGTVYINGTAATWNSVNKYWYIDVSQSTVGAWKYVVSSITDNEYGITTINDVVGAQQVIWDRIICTILTVDDNRVDVGVSVEINATLKYEYDNTDLTDGTVNIEGTSAVHLGSGIWQISVSQSSVTSVTYDTIACSGNTYGITVVNMNGQSVTVIWDRVQITLSVSDNRINVGENATININAIYDYDDSLFVGSIVLNDTQTTKNTVGKYWFTVSSITDNHYGLTVYTSNVVYVIWDKDVMEDLSFSGSTMFNFSARVKSLYDGYFNNRNVRVKVYLNGTLIDSYDVVSDANGYISFTYTHNLHGYGKLGFEAIDLDYGINSDNYTNYEVNYSIDGVIGDLTISPLLYYPGDIMSISVMFKSTSYINDTYLKLNNIYFRPVFCYPDGTVYGADMPFDLFNGTKANEWEYKDESLTIMLPDGAYVLKIQLYIKGSDYLLDEYNSPSFQVLAIGGGPGGGGGGGGAPTINTQALIVKVNDEKGNPLSTVRVEVYDKYGGLVANKTTDEWGELTLTLYEGTYTIVTYYNGLNQTKTVTLSNEPLTVQFSFPFKVVITPTEIFLDANSILMFILGAIGIAVALYLNSRGFVIPVILISFISVASFITGALIGLRMMPPLITLPSFSLPSINAPSFDISFLIDFFTNLFGQIQNAVSGVFSLDLRGILIVSIIVLGISAAYLSHKVVTSGRGRRRTYYRRRIR